MKGNVMFDFLNMLGNHEERKVAHYNKDGVFVDTCLVTDSAQPYETAIEHPAYNNGTMIIVALYDTKEEAQAGHDKWVKQLTSEPLPLAIADVSSSGIATFARDIGCDIGPFERGDA
jgi:hypothetical protein